MFNQAVLSDAVMAIGIAVPAKMVFRAIRPRDPGLSSYDLQEYTDDWDDLGEYKPWDLRNVRPPDECLGWLWDEPDEWDNCPCWYCRAYAAIEQEVGV